MDLNDDIFEGLDKHTECEECEITYTNLAPEEPEKQEKQESKWALRDRLRSRALWAALAGLLVTVLSAFDAWEYIGITAPQFQGILTAIGAVLAAFGVFNDPTSKGRF